LASVLEQFLQGEVDHTQERIIFVNASVSNRNMYFGILQISDEALTTGVEEWL
jgi:hypothetical protein